MNSTVSQRALDASLAVAAAYRAQDYKAAEAPQKIIDEEWQALLAKYPALFTGRSIGLSAGVGWWPALENCFKEISGILEAHPGLSFNAVQIKEKFGGLRFYYDTSFKQNGDDSDKEAAYILIAEAVNRAEVAAAVACDICGQPGARRYGGWIRTLCDAHHTDA